MSANTSLVCLPDGAGSAWFHARAARGGVSLFGARAPAQDACVFARGEGATE